MEDMEAVDSEATGDDGLEYGADGTDGSEDTGDGSPDDIFETLLAEHRAGMESGSGDDDSDDGGDDASVDSPPPKASIKEPTARESVVRRLQASEERVLQLETENKALKAQGPVKAKGSGDLVDDLVSMITGELGCEASDPRVIQRIYEFGPELATELAMLEGRDDDGKFSDRIQRRAQSKVQRDIQRQIDELKAQRENEQQQLQFQREQQNGIASMTELLKSTDAESSYPHMYAGEDDVVSSIFEGIKVLVESGHRITDANATDTIAYVCQTIDAEHARRLQRLEAVRKRPDGQNSRQQPIQKRQTRGPLKDGAVNRREDRGGRTVTASGTGSRQRPVTKSDADKTPDEIFEEMLAESRQTQRRQARPGR